MALFWSEESTSTFTCVKQGKEDCQVRISSQNLPEKKQLLKAFLNAALRNANKQLSYFMVQMLNRDGYWNWKKHCSKEPPPCWALFPRARMIPIWFHKKRIVSWINLCFKLIFSKNLSFSYSSPTHVHVVPLRNHSLPSLPSRGLHSAPVLFH